MSEILSDLKHDVRYGLRMLFKQPATTFLVLLTLALGIGAGSAIFSAVRGTLLHELPYPNDDELVLVWLDNTRLQIRTDITSYPNYADTRDAADTLDDLGVYRPTWTTVLDPAGDSDPERLRAARLGSNVLSILDVPVARGRGFEEAEDLEGSQPVAVLSHELWQRRYGGDEGVLGRSVDLDGESHQVIGVMPEGFDFPGDTELWLPMAMSERGQTSRGSFWLYQIGRLGPDASVAAAQSEMNGIALRLQQDNEGLDGYGLYVQPLREHLLGEIETPMLVLSAAVAFVLLIVCSNVANLLLARAAGRRREMSLRLALGAGRGRLLRQLLTESTLLAGLGGLLGIAVAFFGLRGLIRFGPEELTRLATPSLDPVVLAFAVALSVATGVLVGIAPALGTYRRAASNLAVALQDGTRGAVGALAGRVLRRGLVVVEVALAIVLLVGAGLLLRSFDRLLSVDLGFQTQNVLTVDLSLPGSRYEAPAAVEFFRALSERVAGLPGVEASGLASDPLLPQLARSGNVTVEGVPERPPEERIEVTLDAVTNGYFDAVGVPLLAGRMYQPTDDSESATVALVNEAMARRYWQSADNALGRRFSFGDPEEEDDWITVVGVVGDARRTSFEQAARPSAYFSHAQFAMGSMTLLARVSGRQGEADPMALVPTIRSIVRDMDPNLALAGTGMLSDQIDARVSDRRFHTLLLAAFAGLALFLSVVGVFGVISHLVSQRTREIGVRMALGARRTEVAGWVLGQGLWPVALGIVLGLAGGAALARTLRSMLFEVGTLDPLTFVAVPALLLLVAALATLVPAARATRVAPSEALRYE